MTDKDLFIGLISGTSVDGIDCALVRFDAARPQLLASHCMPIAPELREAILRLCEGTSISLHLLGESDVLIGRSFAAAVNELLAQTEFDAEDIAAIGSHGQTVWHQPFGDAPFTLQLGDPNTIAEHTGIRTVADFRRRDMAAGGEGAPLAPLLHRQIFAAGNIDRAVVNIGGIANTTVLRGDGSCLAFDTGPGNVLLDYWIGKNKGQPFDAGGDWAAAGKVHDDLLQLLMSEPYLQQPPPKSTGRELFNGPWLERQLGTLGATIDAVDVQATLLQFTVGSITLANDGVFTPAEIYVCGGGAHNRALMTQLAQTCPDALVSSTATLGVEPDWVEAIAFAWMARQTVAGKTIDAGAFTGAAGARILGGVYQR